LPAHDPVLNAPAQETIKRLKLNHPKLEASRRRAIQSIFSALDDLSDIELQKLAEGYEKLDSEGKYVRFCGAASYLLRHYST
jgi:hypothetical protein